MIGSTLIHEPDETRLRDLESVDDLSGFAFLDLNVLATIDFQGFVAERNVEWVGGEPLFLDEEAGAALFKVDPAGLEAVLSSGLSLDPKQAADLEAIRAFVSHGFK
jgi:hypothetical protein